MHPISCINTHHDVTDLLNHGMVKIQKLECLEKEHNFSMKQKIPNLCLRWHILRSYHFGAEVTFQLTL